MCHFILDKHEGNVNPYVTIMFDWDMMSLILWKHSGVKGITLWGYNQGQTWVNGSHLVNSNGTERPALQWLRNYLANNP